MQLCQKSRYSPLSKTVTNFEIYFSAHIVQIFQRRELMISVDLVKSYLRKHILTLWGVKKSEDTKKTFKKKIKIEKENDH